MEAFNAELHDEEFNQEVKDMITLGTLDPNWDRGLSKKEARKKFNKIRGHQGTDTSEKILENEDFNQEDFNQEVKDMIALGTLDPNWDRGLTKKEARKKFNKIRGHQGTDTSEKILENEDFNQEDFNQEVKDMITLGTLDPNWDRGLSKKEARKKFNKIRGHQGTDTSEKILENEDFNQEVKDMITLGTLDPNWDRGLSKKEARKKFNKIRGYQGTDTSEKILENEDFNQEDFNQEVKDMITLGTLDPNWDRGLSKKEARKKFNKIRGYQGTDTSEKILENEDFNQEEFNQEVKDMITLGTLDPNWDRGLSKKEARIKFNKIRGYQSPMKVLENEEFNQEVEQFGSRFGSAFCTPKYSDVIFEDERMNTEIADMIQLGIMDKDWAKGLNKNQAKIEFNKIINGPLKCTLFNQVQTAMKTPTASKPKNSSTTKRYSLVTVNRDDPIFKEILYDFKSGGVEKKIKSIQIVRNEKREKLFEEESNQLERLRGNDFHLNIRSLYHGSNAPTNLLCTRGLDQRLSRVGLFGRGIYFSDNVKKSVSYLDNKRGALYKCSVILGDTKVYPDGESHPELKQEPEKDNGDYYDSIKGNVKGHNEYVLYDNRRCLIKYRIVLEGTEDESDMEDLEEDDSIDKLMAAWKRHMNYLVDTCKHDNDDAEDAGEEVRNIEKIRLEIRRRRALDSEQPFTDVNYELLRNERKQWHKHISKAGVSNDKAKPEPVEEDENVDCLEEEYQDTDFPNVGEASTEMVLDNLVSEFMQITNCEDIELATNLIMSQNWDLHRSLDEYFKLF